MAVGVQRVYSGPDVTFKSNRALGAPLTVFAVDIGIHSGFTVALFVFVFASGMVISVESLVGNTEDAIILFVQPCTRRGDACCALKHCMAQGLNPRVTGHSAAFLSSGTGCPAPRNARDSSHQRCGNPSGFWQPPSARTCNRRDCMLLTNASRRVAN